MPRFKVADYKIFHANGKNFVFLIDDKAIFEMDDQIGNIIAEWEKVSDFNDQEFLASLPDDLEDRDELFNSLLCKHLIVPISKGGPKKKYHEKGCSAHLSVQTLVLHLTDFCNLGCVYCYHDQWESPATQKKRMPFHVGKKAVDFALEHSNNYGRVLLVFFGGEPLLELDLIKSIADYAVREGERRGIEVEFSMTTNGTLLTQEAIDVICRCNMGITVSIDGFPEVQNRNRPFRDGRPSYDIVVGNVKKLLEVTKRPVVARVTVTRNPENLQRILEHLLELGFTEVGFSPVTSGASGYKLDKEEMTTLLAQFKVLSKRFLQSIERREFFGFSNIIDLIVTLHQGELMDYPCGAGLSLFAVNPEGRLFVCQRFINQADFCVGDISNGFDLEKLLEFRKQVHISQKKECVDCWVRTICTGGCYHEACLREGDFAMPNIHYCEWIRDRTKVGLETYVRIAADSPASLDELSLMRGYSPMRNL
ncbi:MAG: hypothetical protein DRG59_11085 [Deltaproteobacteria bacterium]|nr:MAG: hypothetical protein DRG59_11085 [Deltaproteobacteria bacterium]